MGLFLFDCSQLILHQEFNLVVGLRCAISSTSFVSIKEIHILINEKSNREFQRLFKISRVTSRPEIEPGSRELSPMWDSIYSKALTRVGAP